MNIKKVNNRQGVNEQGNFQHQKPNIEATQGKQLNNGIIKNVDSIEQIKEIEQSRKIKLKGFNKTETNRIEDSNILENAKIDAIESVDIIGEKNNKEGKKMTNGKRLEDIIKKAKSIKANEAKMNSKISFGKEMDYNNQTYIMDFDEAESAIDELEMDVDESFWALDETDQEIESLIKHTLWMHSDELREQGYNIQQKELTPEERAVGLRAYKKAMKIYKRNRVNKSFKSIAKVASLTAAMLVIATTISVIGTSQSNAGSFFSNIIKVFNGDLRINTDVNAPPPGSEKAVSGQDIEEKIYRDYEQFLLENQDQDIYILGYVPDGYTFYNVMSNKDSDNNMSVTYKYKGKDNSSMKVIIDTKKHTSRSSIDIGNNDLEKLKIDNYTAYINMNNSGITATVVLSDITTCIITTNTNEKNEIINIIKEIRRR